MLLHELVGSAVVGARGGELVALVPVVEPAAGAFAGRPPCPCCACCINAWMSACCPRHSLASHSSRYCSAGSCSGPHDGREALAAAHARDWRAAARRRRCPADVYGLALRTSNCRRCTGAGLPPATLEFALTLLWLPVRHSGRVGRTLESAAAVVAAEKIAAPAKAAGRRPQERPPAPPRIRALAVAPSRCHC